MPQADAPQACTRPWERILAQKPPQVRLVEITPLAPFLAALNAQPPVTDLTADHVYVAEGDIKVRVFLVTNGCMTGYVDLDPQIAAALLGSGT